MHQIERFVFSGQQGPHLLITGGVHGDEFEPMVAIQQLLTLFRNDFDSDSLRGAVTLAPCVNLPAFLRGERCGEDDLDLARTCPGNMEGSPTEQIAAELSELICGADYYIDLHTGGREFRILPFSGYVLHDDHSVLTRQRQMADAFGLPIQWGTAANLEGRTLSVARDANIPAIYAEYMGGGSCSPLGVQAYRQGCLQVCHALGILAPEELPPEESPPDESLLEKTLRALRVEDATPGSGHLQVRHPSPLTGLFAPQVELGQRVERGQPLGVVRSLDGSHEQPVHSDSDGMVLVLRSFPRVLEGQSLGVVLDDRDGELVGADR